MDQHETTTPTERKPLGRRTVLKGAAWSVPAVVAVGATPAFAATLDTTPPNATLTGASASGTTITLTGTIGIAPGDNATASLTNEAYRSTGNQGRDADRDLPGQTLTASSYPSGAWTIELAGARANTRYVFTISQSDAAGNVGSDQIEVTV